MTETIREEGVWWLPKNPKKSRSSGTLVIDGNEARLEAVIGPLAEVGADTFFAPEVILGRTHQGGAYTCFKGYYGKKGKRHTGTGVHSVAIIHVGNLLKGKHFKSPDDAKFKEALWRYSNLHLWMHEAQPFYLQDSGEGKMVVSTKRGKRALYQFRSEESWRRQPPFEWTEGCKTKSGHCIEAKATAWKG